MPFEAEVSVVPASIGDIRVILQDNLDPPDSATVIVQVFMSDGSERRRSAPLQDVVPAQTITQLQSMMVSIRAKANDEIL